MQRFYSLDLRVEVRGSWRRLWALIVHLPPEAALRRVYVAEQPPPPREPERPDAGRIRGFFGRHFGG